MMKKIFPSAENPNKEFFPHKLTSGFLSWSRKHCISSKTMASQSEWIPWKDGMCLYLFKTSLAFM